MTAKDGHLVNAICREANHPWLFTSQSTKALQRIYATYDNSYGPIESVSCRGRITSSSQASQSPVTICAQPPPVHHRC